MRTQPRRILICLALGVASTYVVAGLACKIADGRLMEPHVSAVIDGDLMHARYSTPGFDRYDSRTARYRRGACYGPNIPKPPPEAFERPFDPFPVWRKPPSDQDAIQHMAFEERWAATGFPFRSFEGRYMPFDDSNENVVALYEYDSKGSFRLVALVEGTLEVIWTFPRRGDPRVGLFRLEMPIDPIPIPFAYNTLLYGSAWWVLLPAPFKLRRALRRRAGRCIKCKYDLTGIDADHPCPECGRVENLGSGTLEA